jgi:cell division protein FtsZ
MPKPSQPDPYHVAEMVNATNEPRPEKAATAGSGKNRAYSLFRRVTDAARALQGEGEAQPATQPAPTVARDSADWDARTDDSSQPAPAEREPAARVSVKASPEAPSQPRLSGLDPSERLATSKEDEDMLEIPAFLRRQAN